MLHIMTLTFYEVQVDFVCTELKQRLAKQGKLPHWVGSKGKQENFD